MAGRLVGGDRDFADRCSRRSRTASLICFGLGAEARDGLRGDVGLDLLARASRESDESPRAEMLPSWAGGRPAARWRRCPCLPPAARRALPAADARPWRIARVEREVAGLHLHLARLRDLARLGQRRVQRLLELACTDIGVVAFARGGEGDGRARPWSPPPWRWRYRLATFCGGPAGSARHAANVSQAGGHWRSGGVSGAVECLQQSCAFLSRVGTAWPMAQRRKICNRGSGSQFPKTRTTCPHNAAVTNQGVPRR